MVSDGLKTTREALRDAGAICAGCGGVMTPSPSGMVCWESVMGNCESGKIRPPVPEATLRQARACDLPRCRKVRGELKWRIDGTEGAFEMVGADMRYVGTYPEAVPEGHAIARQGQSRLRVVLLREIDKKAALPEVTTAST